MCSFLEYCASQVENQDVSHFKAALTNFLYALYPSCSELQSVSTSTTLSIFAAFLRSCFSKTVSLEYSVPLHCAACTQISAVLSNSNISTKTVRRLVQYRYSKVLVDLFLKDCLSDVCIRNLVE